MVAEPVPFDTVGGISFAGDRLANSVIGAACVCRGIETKHMIITPS
jgi:hypothetical protein